MPAPMGHEARRSPIPGTPDAAEAATPPGPEEAPPFLNNAMRRDDLAWNDWPAIKAFLQDQLVCRLAVHDAPYPYVVGQSFRLVGDTLLLHCSRFGRLAGLVKADPHVTVEVDQLVALLKAPKGQNTSFEYYSVLARCIAEFTEEVPAVKRQQYEVLGKYRYERGYIPLDDGAPSQIIAFRCRIVEMSAKKRILADGQYSPPGQPRAPYVRFPLPPPAAVSSLPADAFDPERFRAELTEAKR